MKLNLKILVTIIVQLNRGGFMKENSGFTLIELLGAVIIIAMLAIISFPLVLDYIRQSQKILVESELTVIKVATESYLNDNKNDYPRNNGTRYCIAVQDLIDGDYLKGSFVEANEGKLINDAQSKEFRKNSYVRMKIVSEKYTYDNIFQTLSACEA